MPAPHGSTVGTTMYRRDAQEGLGTMLQLTRSRLALFLAAGGAVGVAFGYTLLGTAYVFLSGFSVQTSRNLQIAGSWLAFVGWALVLAAIVSAAWGLLLERQWPALAEVIGAAAATLLIAIGFLIGAAAAPNTPDSSGVVTAVGIAGWMILLLVTAARRSLVEHEQPTVPHQAALWAAAAAALLAMAVGAGLPTPSITDTSLAVTAAAFSAVGLAGLACTLALARARGLIQTSRFAIVYAGLWLLSVAFVAAAVASGIVLGPPPYSLTGFQVGLSIPDFILAAALLILAFAAWSRVYELSGPADDTSIATAPAPGAAGSAVPPPAPATGPAAGPAATPTATPAVGTPTAPAAAPSTSAPAPPMTPRPMPPPPPVGGPGPPTRPMPVRPGGADAICACGAALPAEARFCPACGRPVTSTPPSAGPTS